MIKHFPLWGLAIFLAFPPLQAHGDGGAVAAGALGGLAIGTMIGSASSRDSGKASRAEREAMKAQDEAERAKEKAEQVRIERDQERVRQLEKELERREMERKIEAQSQGSSTTFTLLLIAIGLLFFTILGLAVFMFRRKP